MINESFPAIEFHDFYIHYLNSSIVLVLYMSALLLTVYMFVQDSTVHVFSGICDQWVRTSDRNDILRCVWYDLEVPRWWSNQVSTTNRLNSLLWQVLLRHSDFIFLVLSTSDRDVVKNNNQNHKHYLCKMDSMSQCRTVSQSNQIIFYVCTSWITTRDPWPFEAQPPVTGRRGSSELAFRQWRYSWWSDTKTS